MGAKRTYKVYRVTRYGSGTGEETENRVLAGITRAVSEAKARANVEYRDRGKSLYGGYEETDLGSDAYVSVHYEAVGC